MIVIDKMEGLFSKGLSTYFLFDKNDPIFVFTPPYQIAQFVKRTKMCGYRNTIRNMCHVLKKFKKLNSS